MGLNKFHVVSIKIKGFKFELVIYSPYTISENFPIFLK